MFYQSHFRKLTLLFDSTSPDHDLSRSPSDSRSSVFIVNAANKTSISSNSMPVCGRHVLAVNKNSASCKEMMAILLPEHIEDPKITWGARGGEQERKILPVQYLSRKCWNDLLILMTCLVLPSLGNLTLTPSCAKYIADGRVAIDIVLTRDDIDKTHLDSQLSGIRPESY